MVTKMTKEEYNEFRKKAPNMKGEIQYDHPIGPEREEPSHQETAPVRSAARTARPVQQNNDLSFASVGAAIVRGGKTAGKVLRSIPQPTWINTGKSGKPATLKGGSSSAPSWLNSGVPGMSTPEWLSNQSPSRQTQQPRSTRPEWIRW